ncbi:DUF4034 domain-containing protein [uncultured Deinococcus sp.]|uniref:DUF4034 domain-containing protein n=1 Tax=uncultured Deinococcus sp. TaxID=158789 RepID=UPI00258BA5A9|nr:DUF4034 domain-containing protein [uncultured Deinococcus sp.]
MSEPSTDVLALLRRGDYKQLDQHLGEGQRSFEAGQSGEQDLKALFGPFDLGDITLSEPFSNWLDETPGSYVALVALAMWQARRAFDLRGGATSNLVSDQGYRGMFHFMQQAEAAARHATTLSPNPLGAWLVIGLIHNGQGCELEPGDVEAERYPDWYTEPLRLNPRSLEVRRTMLAHLRTEWGGSETQMLAFVRQQQESGDLSVGDQQKLWGQYHQQVAHHAWLFGEDGVKALEHARLAADLNDANAELLFALLTDQNAASAQRGAALERFLSHLERHPDHGLWYARSALSARTDILAPYVTRLNTVLTHMAQTGDDDAAGVLAQLWAEAPGLGFADPVPLLLQARERGSVVAANLLVWLAFNNKATALQDRRAHILAAADLGSASACWEIWENFGAYQEQGSLDERARYRYLLRAADAGENEARMALARQLRAGRVELGEDGVLRPVDTQPIQSSLDYAKHLLERAAGEDYKPARTLLTKTKDAQWQADTAQRLKGRLSKAPQKARETVRPPWFLIVLLVLGILRACAHFSAPAEFSPIGLPAPQEQLETAGR